MILNILLITIIITYVWGYKDVPNQIASIVMKKLTNGKVKQVYLNKPLGCPECMTFWIVLTYTLISLPLKSILIAFILSLSASFAVKYILYLLQILDALIVRILEALQMAITTKY